jgi:hypothetical protein
MCDVMAVANALPCSGDTDSACKAHDQRTAGWLRRECTDDPVGRAAYFDALKKQLSGTSLDADYVRAFHILCPAVTIETPNSATSAHPSATPGP